MSSSSRQISSFCNFSLFTIMAYTSFNRFSLKSETCILPHLQNQFRLHEKMSYHCASATVKFAILFTRSIGQTQCSTKSTESINQPNQSINQSIDIPSCTKHTTREIIPSRRWRAATSVTITLPPLLQQRISLVFWLFIGLQH